MEGGKEGGKGNQWSPFPRDKEYPIKREHTQCAFVVTRIIEHSMLE